MEHEELKLEQERELFNKLSWHSKGALAKNQPLLTITEASRLANLAYSLGKQEGIPKLCTRCNSPFLSHEHIHLTRSGAFHTGCYKANKLGVEEGLRMAVDTSKVNRVEVIDHTRSTEHGGGRVYTFWNEYHERDSKNPKVEVSLQDEGRTLKVFITSLIKKEE